MAERKYQVGDKVYIRAVVTKADGSQFHDYGVVVEGGSQLLELAEDEIHGKVAGNSGLTSIADLERQYQTMGQNLNHLREAVDKANGEIVARLNALEAPDDRASKSDLANVMVRLDKEIAQLRANVKEVEANTTVAMRVSMATGAIEPRLATVERDLKAYHDVVSGIGNKVNVVRGALDNLAEYLSDDEEDDDDDE